MGLRRRLFRGRSLRLNVAPGVASGGQRRFLRGRSLRPKFTPGVTVGLRRRSVRGRCIVTPGISGARRVSRSHQTNCQSDPSNLHVTVPYLLELTRTMRVLVLLRAQLSRGQAELQCECIKKRRDCRRNLLS